MNREIRFRAWSKKGKTMIYPESKNNESTSTHYTINAWCESESEETILMQYTGLLDKNSKEIYEGDIVETDNGTERFIDVVKWDDDCVGFRVDGSYYFDDCEVIGNIYENPELLKS